MAFKIQRSIYRISITIRNDVKHPELAVTPKLSLTGRETGGTATRASAPVTVADNGEFDANTVSHF